ncbi:MAG: TRAP transporter substrate-binding protein [Burkholderiales bacterium]|nr:TRAP transporter substrate-binding protein [Burkholderiales bacterium]
MRTHLKVAAAAVAVALSTTVQAQTQWDMPTPYPDANFHTQNIAKFAEDVKKMSGGKLEIKIHSNGSLFKHPEIKNAVRGGQVPIGEFLLSSKANENPVFEADSVPFLASSYDEAAKLWKASKGAVEKALDKEGLMVLYAVPWPPQGLYAKKTIDGVADLKGVKFRAYNAATETLAKLAGAVPTQVEAPDIPQAFSTGRVDAMVTSPSTGANSKAWDFVKHYYDVQGWLPKNVVIVNKRAFRGLDKSVQKALLDAAKAAEPRGWSMSKTETKEKTDALRNNGMTVHTPSKPLMSELKTIGQQMTDAWVKKAGADGQAVLKAYRGK